MSWNPYYRAPRRPAPADQKPGAEAEQAPTDDLLLWKLARLLECGYGIDDAQALASCSVSWHDADRLIRAGCPPHVARTILLPL